MITSLRKSYLGTTQAASSNKFTINFIKEKCSSVAGTERYYFICIEVSYSMKENEYGRSVLLKDGQLPLESVKIGMLTKDPQLALEKFNEVKDEDILSISKEIDSTVEKYSELMYLYSQNVELAKASMEGCVKAKMDEIPYQMKIPWQVCQQAHKKSYLKGDFEKNHSDTHLFLKYLAEISIWKDKKKMDRKNLKIDVLSLSCLFKSYKLDFVYESTIRQDFLSAYEILLTEFSDFSFKIKVLTGHEKSIQYFSKFLKEHLLAIFYIE